MVNEKPRQRVESQKTPTNQKTNYHELSKKAKTNSKGSHVLNMQPNT